MPLQRRLVLTLAGALLLAPAIACARLSDSIDDAQRAACGLTRLSADQVACVDAIVDRELRLAKQGNTKAFAKSFTTRRTDSENAATGLPALSPAERQALDDLVAGRLAALRDPAPSGKTHATAGTAPDSIAFAPRKLEVHGTASVWVGSDFRGGSMYGGSLVTTLSDPSGKWALTLGYAHSRGNGMYPYSPYMLDPWDYGYGYRRGWSYDPFWWDEDYGWPRSSPLISVSATQSRHTDTGTFLSSGDDATSLRATRTLGEAIRAESARGADNGAIRAYGSGKDFGNGQGRGRGR